MGRADAYSDQVLVLETPDSIGRLEGRPGVDPQSGNSGIWIPAEQLEDAQMRGILH